MFNFHFFILILGCIWSGPRWVSSVWLPFSADRSIDYCCLHHIPTCLSFYAFILIACPTSTNGNILLTTVFPHLQE